MVLAEPQDPHTISGIRSVRMAGTGAPNNLDVEGPGTLSLFRSDDDDCGGGVAEDATHARRCTIRRVGSETPTTQQAERSPYLATQQLHTLYI